MDSRVDQELRNIFEAKLKITDYSNDLSMLNTQRWDSLAHVGLILEIEKRFSIRISTADAIEMVSVRAIREILKEHGLN